MPFSHEQFLDVFARYNEAVFPLQVALLIVALIAIRLADNPDKGSSKGVACVLGFLWAWMGVVYHWGFFSAINPLALAFGIAFLIQSALILYAGAFRDHLVFNRRSGGARFAGTSLIVYSLLVYPIAGIAAGHSFPFSPTFGLPCPTTIFMFGLLLRSGRSVPLYILPIPVAWSVVGLSAAFSLGMWEDMGLLPGAVAGTVFVIRRRWNAGRLNVQGEFI